MPSSSAHPGTSGGPPPASPWFVAEVVGTASLTPLMRSIVLRPERWPGHLAGQHIKIKLTAPDGYSAQRDYSIASVDDGSGLIEIVVDRLPEGEVSPFLHDELSIGDRIEIRGPIGGHFVWRAWEGGPLLLIAGGSGIVPLLAMLRVRARLAAPLPAALLYAARRWDDLGYRDDLIAMSEADPDLTLRFAISRDSAAHPAAHAGRISAALVEGALASLGDAAPEIFVCGSNSFVEAAVALCLAGGASAAQIRTERFGG